MTLSERLARLELASERQPIARDLAVIRLQLARAEGKLIRGQHDVRRELRIVEQRVTRAEHRLLSAISAHIPEQFARGA